jgi:predicted house-cleaning noncanonical NTP pyrophosphatase (MazG superfamily)
LKVSQTDKDMLLTELADVREVCNAIATYYGCTEDELQIIQNKKREEKG